MSRIILSQYDKPLIAAGAGVISAIIKALLIIVGKKFGLLSLDLVQISAAILTKNSIHGFWEYILGWMVVCILGSIIGVSFYYSLIILGRDYLIFKAIGAAVLVWFIDTSSAGLVGVPLINQPQYTSHLVFFSSSIVFGVIFSWLLKRFSF